MVHRSVYIYMGILAITLGILFFPYFVFEADKPREPNTLRVMTYSSFIQKWGAGPEIAKRFKEETGLTIEWINAGNAGLIIERLKFKKDRDQPDMVLGLDQFSIHEARKNFQWTNMQSEQEGVQKSLLPEGAYFFDFLAYDWGPMTFIYKKGEVEPPESLEDLVDERFKNKLILQDPRMSSPGLQFFLWVLTDMGEEQGFLFLEKLKDNIKVMSPSWSSSYSIFKMEQPTTVFSYFTSPFFHQIEEKDENFAAMSFKTPHPIQVEFAGIPDFCINCEGAKKLAQFLLRKDIQKILMKKNYMFPVEGQALEGSPFKVPTGVKYYRPIESLSLIKRKRELVNRWKKVFY